MLILINIASQIILDYTLQVRYEIDIGGVDWNNLSVLGGKNENKHPNNGILILPTEQTSHLHVEPTNHIHISWNETHPADINKPKEYDATIKKQKLPTYKYFWNQI